MHEAAERVIPLRDGTLTRADVWTPAGNEPGPAILVRTPYGKRTLFHQSPIDALTAMERGYRFVVQDGADPTETLLHSCRRRLMASIPSLGSLNSRGQTAPWS